MVLTLSLGIASAAAQDLTVIYEVRRGADGWGLEGGAPAYGPRVAGIFAPFDYRGAGLRSPRQKRPVIDEDAVVPLLASHQRCSVRAQVDEHGHTVAAEAEGCPDLLAEPFRAAVARWRWTREASDRQIDVVFLLDGARWAGVDEGCIVPYTLVGSGVPVPDWPTDAHCHAEPSNLHPLAVPAIDAPREARTCLIRMVAGAPAPRRIEGCDPRLAAAVEPWLDTWTVKPHGGRPTPYTIALSLL